MSIRHLSLSAALLLGTLTACGSDYRTTEPVRTGPGVSADSISLGVLTDMTGPFKGSSVFRIRGYELYLEQLNKRGGVCGRRVELKQKDHAYDVEKALDGYFELEPQVLGFIDVLGQPMTAAIEPDLMQTRALTVPGSWAADLLGNPHMMIVGTTYDLDIINGLDHYKRKSVLNAGDTIGHIHLRGSFGDNALEGSRFAAGNWGMKIVEQAVTETTANFTEQISALKAANAKVLVLSLTPPQTAAAVGIAAQLGWTAPILVNAVGYDPAIMQSPVAPVFAKQVLIPSPVAPWNGNAEGMNELRDGYQARWPGEPGTLNTVHGYTVAMAFVSVLEKACGKKDLTRDGVLRAFHDTNGLSTKGLTGQLKFSLVGRPSSTQSYMTRPDAAVPGTLKVVEDLYESELVKLKGTRAR
ncbi:amino acid/amide ABC transporter substrate-binding protein (HAAT family) [Lentzea atacamensis]|uniref:Amino acid/amide ABC transporter substrate-binding protein (HAAT family) n=1 Tax=Lentzea atacamensis TaxID=531938 RepID=A0ABX9EKN1_9PSEU|nr:ABC transporter substrate-binding protein [Lentzea atacamensis]RAS70711.1 amino acid/amide ABC transporter substrate-binding protein (HAAT family) [Lentzea atacamensis]